MNSMHLSLRLNDKNFGNRLWLSTGCQKAISNTIGDGFPVKWKELINFGTQGGVWVYS